ncbi:MAG: sugar-binding protein, partial [Lentisphaeria bacterium]
MHLHPLRNLAIVLAAIVLAAVALGAEPAPAANLLRNGDFAQAAPDGQPVDWKLDATGNIQMTVVPGAGHELGSNALHVVDKSNYGAGLGPLRQFVPLQPGREYAISCWTKGDAGGFLSFALGNKWRQRLWLRGGAEWTWYGMEFTCNAEEMAWPGAYEVCLQVQDLCDAWVADARLEALNALAAITVPYDPLARICVLPPAAFEPNRTSLPAGLPKLAPRLEGAPGQGLPKAATPFSAAASIAMAYDDQGLILYAKIDDDRHFANSGEDMWNGDCLQIAIDPDGNLNPDRDAKDIELGLNLYDGKPGNYCWTLNRPLAPDELEYAVTPLKNGYFIAARLKWSFLKGVNVKNNGRFAVNLVLNDSDDGVNRRAAALAPGLYTYKGNKNSTLCLLQNRCVPVTLLPEAPVVSDYLRAKLIVVPATAGATPDYRLRATAADGKVIEISLPCDTAPQAGVPLAGTLKLKTADLPGGIIRLAVLNGARTVATATVEKKDFYGKCRAQLTALKARGAASLAKAATVTAKTPRPRLSAATAIYERQIVLLEKDLLEKTQERKDYYGERGLRICDELAQLLTVIDAEIADAQAGRAAPADYQYRSSPRTLRNGYFEAAMADAATGATTERPVIFSGYGHFNGAINDIEWFHNIEANAIQFETGPDRFITGENPDGSFIINPASAMDLAKVLERAWTSNVAVIFLLSPHYYPEWALTRHPEAAWNSGSFLRYDIQHPYARRLLEAYLTTLIPVLRNSPGAGAVHSFCISNEPSYRPS